MPDLLFQPHIRAIYEQIKDLTREQIAIMKATQTRDLPAPTIDELSDIIVLDVKIARLKEKLRSL